MFVGLLLGVVVAAIVRPTALGTWAFPSSFLASAGILCIVGMIDDRFPLSAYCKLPGQFLATLPIVLMGFGIDQLALFGWEISLGWFGAIWTVGWLMLGMNALNLLDGSDGLASTIGMVIALAIAAVGAFQGFSEVTFLCLALAGALAGFLVYNSPPARIYLGDFGSTLIGLTVALLAMRSSHTESNKADLAVMGLLLFVPLLDTSLAILRRKLKGQRIVAGDRGHLHHQLQDRGFNAWQVAAFLGALSLASGAAAVSAVLWEHPALATMGLAALAAALVYGRFLARQEIALLQGWWSQIAAPMARTESKREVGPAAQLRIFPPVDVEEPSSGATEPAAGRPKKVARKQRVA